MIRPRWQGPISRVVGVLILAVATLATMSWTEPPRFDGAGYATLGRSLAEGRGYREINRPEAPRHSHFPPGYPAFLALIWKSVGSDDVRRFTIQAHATSLICLLIGLWAVGRWWSRTELRGVATCLTMALAINWTWVRTGGVIRSEPLAIAIGGLTLLLSHRGSERPVSPIGLAGLAGLLGLGILTRQVFACWAFAVAVDFAMKRRPISALAILGGAFALVAPWVAWQHDVGSGSQTGLFRGEGLLSLVAGQALFYARRIPDAVIGPFIEVATVFGRSPWLSVVATLGGIALTSTVLAGWVRLARSPRRRLGGLIPLATMPLLLVWPFTEAGRFLIPLVPFVLMGAVEGGGVLFHRLRFDRPKLWAARLVLAVSIPYSVYAVATNRSDVERRTQHDFDAGCAWIAARSAPGGTVMGRHLADLAWSSKRLAVDIPDADPARIAAEIRRNQVAFLILDEDRYARSPKNPLRSFVEQTAWVRKVWTQGTTSVYQVERDDPSR